MKPLLTAIIILFTSTAIMAQKTFLYEITLYEQFKNPTNWDDEEKVIQQEHIAYLDSLTKNRQLEIAGIIDQGLKDQSGLIVLTVNSYGLAKEIALNDPAIKKGMMSVRLRPINVYFRKD